MPTRERWWQPSLSCFRPTIPATTRFEASCAHPDLRPLLDHVHSASPEEPPAFDALQLVLVHHGGHDARLFAASDHQPVASSPRAAVALLGVDRSHPMAA